MAWFKRRILHAPNQILILVDSNEYVRLIWFKRRIVLPNKIAEREWRVLNSHSSKHKLFNLISIQFGTCKMPSDPPSGSRLRCPRFASSCSEVWLRPCRRRILHAVNLAIRFGACKMRRLNLLCYFLVGPHQPFLVATSDLLYQTLETMKSVCADETH